MKKFLVVLQYELKNYFKNKSYMISTIFLIALVGIGMFLPRFFDMSGILGTPQKTESAQNVNESDKSKSAQDAKELKNMIIYDKTGSLNDLTLLNSVFSDVKWQIATNENDVKNSVKEDKSEAGFVVNSLTSYDYYIYDKSMSDSNTYSFNGIMTTINQINYCAANGLDYSTVVTAFNPTISSNEQILGKDMTQNFWYCYILVIVIFMAIIIYGIMIATSVTQEKSNRTIELLITSTNPNSLLFGKVIAGAIASLGQVGLILCVAVFSYRFNQAAWGNKLDMILAIPNSVLITFGMFGIGGFLFYAFIYGAMGALVSKTEDINKSAGSVQMIIMIVYFVVLVQLSNINGIVIKIASFLPFSSYSAMFARVAMGTVAPWEIAVSFLILVVSIVLVGMFGAKIYRMGTLRYGNPIKLSNAIKYLKHNK
ncbi:ABC transporter permease [[Clostridium] fimetarium]|uniref:ABC-2 type transport system permease protein n=1 Tax=[Clostridium] fimetarium TaxID=99656 RepID=A0A1I0RE01_9FIRM|nr:ABC transporter permease [[Clostridium] fimetarium]SEW39108.1 ABC-2 type transport system permease protein [[Clostridium] fimetarium]